MLRSSLTISPGRRPPGPIAGRHWPGLVQVEHFRPGDLERIPVQGFDLYLHIDDGLEYRHPAYLRPSAWWAIDTHVNFDWCLTKPRDFDLVFAAQRDGAERLKQAGIASASWLPLACDPAIHGKHPVEKRWDICFVGNLFPGPRAELLDLIQRRYPNHFVGQRYFEEMARTYSASRIVWNRSLANDVNMRVFEGWPCGSMLLTNDLRDNGQEELFKDGLHLATYRVSEEMLDKIAYYLARPEIRERIAAAGREEAIAKHTYRHRMERVLHEVEAGTKAAMAVEAASPTQTQRASEADSLARASGSDGTPSHHAATGQDPTYFEFARPELLALVPESAKRVLDIGCGAGRLGEAIKKRQQAEVIGIECEHGPASAARARLDRVLVGNIEQLEPDFGPGSFDAIICGDVLEHLRDPLRVLRRSRTWLKPDGRLIASIPNVRHHSVVRSLLAGNWTYESAGLLDQTHLRFFTRREIMKLVYRAGFDVRDLQMVPGPGDEDLLAQARAGNVQIGALRVGGMSPAEAQEFYAYQYLLSAVPAPELDHGLTSIVIATHNQLPYTRQCLDSIRRYTDQPYEIIVVDNGSSDGTPEVLRSMADVRLIANAENRGFPAACNQGIRAANGSQILLLNNNTIVTTGWLDRMLCACTVIPRSAWRDLAPIS